MIDQKKHRVDFCVVGGGLAGMSAAVSAARAGIKVALIQDRPVLGGNASSEIRMWVCGAHGENNRETGILEEIKLQNRATNPLGNYAIWDSILYGKVRVEPNILLLLNASVCDIDMAGSRIRSVKVWQLTTYTWHTVEAELFADCSGDSILAPLSGAEFRVGREARDEFNESIAPVSSDNHTMGMSCLFQTRETPASHYFHPPEWAHRYESDDALPRRDHSLGGTQNYWWLEVGGMQDSIHDTEELRDELLKMSFGLWDHVKNRGDHDAERWVLDWAGFLPGKRESRRYVGDHILNQRDIEAEGRAFHDIVAYGGWTMDDHFPEGFHRHEAGTIFHPAPSPYGIPYRSLYSKNIENLLFAGRNISATHTALSSTRVMGTCAVMGQAVGTAAAIAIEHATSPRGVYVRHIEELKQKLMEADCYLPFNRRAMSRLTGLATLSANGAGVEVLRNGYDRPIGSEDNGYTSPLGAAVEYTFAEAELIEAVRLVFDSDLTDERDGHMPSFYELGPEGGGTPRVTPIAPSMTKCYRIESCDESGRWHVVTEVSGNYLRLNTIPVGRRVRGVRYVPTETWGAEGSHLFAFDLF